MEKIKICFTSPTFSAYSETFIQNLKNGIDGEIFHCFGGMFPNQSEDQDLANYLKPKLHHSILRRLGLLQKPLDQLYFSDYLKKKKIDLIFANYGPAGAKVAPVVKNIGIPLIVHFHGFDASVREIISNNREAYKEMFTIAKSIIVVSEAMKHDLINLGAPENKIKKIIYAPNSNFLKIIPDYYSNQLLSIGRFVEKKAPYLTLMAYKLAKGKCPKLKLKFIGDGPLLSICRDLAKSLHIKDIEFSGVFNRKEIQNEMSNSFCFIQHSKRAENGDKEGTPVSILEAMAAGLPVISTNHAGIPEIVIDGQNGFIVEEGDVEAMAEKMIQLHVDRKLAEIFGKKGKSTIEQNHNSTNYFKNINALILDCVDA
ncbi:Glycosyltransferase involved in cell wall bisynthesis [Algoriphagus faecimaris]|uniref:Glycosyltransferase involved in cell wall bisynthesis n=1 Tax=Algoriphagus faecimaris TaxID=686796 RepID=A0A1G6PRU9_9BACT|nr:glycosyltransferase [Algoriphagus faecimaris]SDC82940.1 Glycosyltransferase involved in cell wall bisynthesis [Algoriphagus faecimaris]